MSEHFDNPAQVAPDANVALPDLDPAPDSQLATPDPTLEPATDDGQFTTLDVDGDGLVDALLVTYGDGGWTGAFDVTGDGESDIFAVSTTGSGDPDLLISEAGDGGYLMQVDTDGDGVPDTEVAISRDELAQEFPAALEFLDMQFDGLVVTGAGEPGDTAGDAGDGEWTVSQGQLLGDPDGASEHWFEQAANGFCVPASVTQIVAAFVGAEFADESFFVERANELHLFTVGPDGSPSMTAEGAATLLVDAGVDAHVESDLTILDLENYLDEGRPVMLAVDADEMWYDEADSVDEAANHAVVLTGIDPVNGVAIISDPGSPTGNEYTMPVSELDRMWADSGRQAVVVDAPAPDAVAVDAFGAGPVADGTPAADHVEAAEPLPVSEDSLMTTSGPVDFMLEHPWIVIPVVVGTGALLRKKP